MADISNLNNKQDQTNIICDICDALINSNDLCTLHLQGIKEKLSCHLKCVETYYSCKGNFSLLPEGRLKTAIYKSIAAQNTKLIHNTGITIRDKQARYIIAGLQISDEEGYRRINSLAINFYGLPKPKEHNGEFYSIDYRKQIVLLQKHKYNINGDTVDATLFSIRETYIKD
jgi:hypothetical protein